jgi:eukaryotic-like serine/threonine-protein kinase
MLTTGARLGQYEILGTLGAGGMGQVYRARDTRLGRDVAIKILPEAFAADPDRMARFEREARLLASLNHQNIATIHGIEESGTVRGLVLELIDGETLADRIAGAKGSSLPIAQTVAIAKQLVDALDAAHEKGIVHRDLKPTNIKITPGGSVKVLDFGLAKAVTDESVFDPADSPTVTVAGTRHGVILGTAAYMSPEQTRGRGVDKRTDIWAFGCVLFEMLTGRATFGRDTTSDTIAAILEREPDFSSLPPATPSEIVRLVRECLHKEPGRRLRDIGDARLLLELRDDERASAVPQNRAQWFLPVTMLILGLGVGAGFLYSVQPPLTSPIQRVQFVMAGPAGQLSLGRVIPSPNGSRLVFSATDDAGQSALWIRSFAATEPRRLIGTEGAQSPFWSPDGRNVGFVAAGRLKRIDVDAGLVQTICNGCITGDVPGASWNNDGTILLSPSNRTPIYRVSANGGTPEPLTSLDSSRNENSHRGVTFLPDGRHFIFTARSDVQQNTGIYLSSLDSGDRKWLMQAQSSAEYAPPGFLLTVREGTLVAWRFDLATLQLSGDPIPVAGNVGHNPASAQGLFNVSADGRVLVTRAPVQRLNQLVWVDRKGTSTATVGQPRVFQQFKLAPNGKHATTVLADEVSGNRDIWLLELETGRYTRLTTHPANDWHPVWSPDSRNVLFASDRNGASSIYRREIEISGLEELVLASDRATTNRFPSDWSAEGLIAYFEDTAKDTQNIGVIRLTEKSLVASLNSPFLEADGKFSPDGRWLAYDSNESGAIDVYVMASNGSGPKYRISTGGGQFPQWRGDGRELFYLSADGHLMSVAVKQGDLFEAAPAIPLFDSCMTTIPPFYDHPFAVAGDGMRSLWACPIPQSETPSVSVTLNWLAEIQK